MVAVEGSGDAAEEFEEGREAIGGAAVYVGSCGDGGFEQGKIALLDCLVELLVSRGGKAG
jgi:hypothetical protein